MTLDVSKDMSDYKIQELFSPSMNHTLKIMYDHNLCVERISGLHLTKGGTLC